MSRSTIVFEIIQVFFESTSIAMKNNDINNNYSTIIILGNDSI